MVESLICICIPYLQNVMCQFYPNKVGEKMKEAPGGKGDTMSKLGKQFLEIHFCLTSQNIITPCHKRAIQKKIACVLSHSVMSDCL